MPRPCKRRKICALPKVQKFGVLEPQKAEQCPPIIMTLDEFETIRLIDQQGMSQQQCAEQMGVARTTVQAIYAQARRKLAECLVQGRELVIDGGEYILCNGHRHQCYCLKCCRN